MICSLKFRKEVILKMPWKSYRKNVPLDVVLLVLKLCPIQVVVSLPLWIKLTMNQLLLCFLSNFSSFLSYVRGIPVTNHFSLFIDRYILCDYMPWAVTPDISSSSKNINSTARVSRISFRFLWLCLHETT